MPNFLQAPVIFERTTTIPTFLFEYYNGDNEGSALGQAGDDGFMWILKVQSVFRDLL